MSGLKQSFGPGELGTVDVDRIVPAHLEGDDLWRRNGEYVAADAYDNTVLRIAELEAAIRTAIRRFELLALANDELVNGVRPSVGAAELRRLINAR